MVNAKMVNFYFIPYTKRDALRFRFLTKGDEIVRFLVRNHIISAFMDGKKAGLKQETGTRDRFYYYGKM